MLTLWQLLRRVLRSFDASDLRVGAGVGLLGWGLWSVSPPAAMAATGGLLLAVEFASTLRRS